MGTLNFDGTDYSVFMIDPPWLKKKGGLRKVRPNQDRKLAYETLPTEEIFSLLDEQVLSKAAEVNTVFIWTVDQFLLDCEQQMEKRGYKRHCRFVWDKLNGVAPAFTVRYTHEYLLWYYKPKMLPISKEQQGKFKTVFAEKSREHSRKPDFAYQMVDALYPTEKKIDVFSREKRAGWDQFGDQKDYFGVGQWALSISTEPTSPTGGGPVSN